MLYEFLDLSIYKKGLKKKVIAKALNISEKTFRRKIRGETPFTWNETCIIRDVFFPEFTKDELFQKRNDQEAS